MSETTGTGDSEQWFATVDGGVIIFDDSLTLYFEATDAAHSGNYFIDFTSLRSVVLKPDGNDTGAIEFSVMVTDAAHGHIGERILVMRVSAEDGLSAARDFVPEIQFKAAGPTATPDSDTDYSFADNEAIWISEVSEGHNVSTTAASGSGTEKLPQAEPERYSISSPKTSHSDAIWQSWIAEAENESTSTANDNGNVKPSQAEPSATTNGSNAPGTSQKRLNTHVRPLIAAGAALAAVALILFINLGSNDESATPSVVGATAFTRSTTAIDSETTTAAPRVSTSTADQRATPGTVSIDTVFVQTLTDFGIEYSSRTQAVSTAKTTCRTISNSVDPTRAILAASQIAQSSGGYTRTEANDFVGLAVVAYCPEFNAYVQN
ncbi:DUF732 domain-containing protein [Rhodococcoides fascians]|uniref:DUF732 domain-containing protein n=1 Tax=Rhodococcoides fascians TaxID=1828 RepID=UPI00050CB8D7|nr:DUF732 domain-containing protein [Rhodococcus fascians]WQH29986.1 DUF732 domain-containing protein [Rhodococcus fascians]